MEHTRIAAVWLLYKAYRRKKNRGQRKMWVHPIIEKRLQLGVFHTLFRELREDERRFFNYFRMSMMSFDELHSKLKASLQRQNTVMRDCIDPMEMLAVTLR